MIQAGLDVRPERQLDEAARDEFVLRQEQGTFFHRTSFERVVQRVFGHARRDLLAWRGGEIVGVLPLVRCKSPFGAASLISVPYGVYGGPLGVDREVEHELFRAAERMALAERVGRLELRCLHDSGLDLLRSDLYSTFIRELPGRVEDVLARMPKKSRAEARKARDRHGLELVQGSWCLEDLIRLFHRNKRELGSPALPARFFRACMQELGAGAVVHLVRKGEEPLAAVMSFFHKDTLLAYYSGTADGADREYSASNFMYMALQEWAVREGFRWFDFGRSRRDSGAHQFKEHQGFEARPLPYSYRLVGDKGLPSLNPSNPKTKLLRETWSRLPMWLTERLATAASRYLP